MRKFLDFHTYKLLQKKSLNDMNRWLVEFYKAAYADGFEAGEESKFKELSAETNFVWSEEELLTKLQELPGIGAKRAGDIADKLLEWPPEEVKE